MLSFLFYMKTKLQMDAWIIQRSWISESKEKQPIRFQSWLILFSSLYANAIGVAMKPIPTPAIRKITK